MPNIAAISTQLESFFKNNPKVESDLILKLGELFGSVVDVSEDDDSWYCKIFKRPQGAVVGLFKIVPLDEAEVADSVRSFV